MQVSRNRYDGHMGKRASKNDDSRGGSPREQLWSTTFVLVVASTLCCFMVGQGLNSSTSVYVALYGGTAAYAGVLAAVFSGAAAVVRLLSGPLIDGRGRRIVMLFGFAVLIVGTVGPLFTHDVAPFVVFRILQGAGFSAVTTASATAAADALPASRMGEGIGYYGLGQALSMSVGSPRPRPRVDRPARRTSLSVRPQSQMVGLAMIFLCRYESTPRCCPRKRSTGAGSKRGRRGRTNQEQPRRAGRANEVRRQRVAKRAEAAGALEAAGRAGAAEAIETAETTTSTAQSRMEGRPKRESIASRIFEKHALPGTLPMIVLSPAFGFVIFFVGLYGASLGVGNAGLFYTLSAVSMILVRLKSGAFMDRFAPIKILPVALACGLIAFGMLVACGTVLDGAPVRDAVFNLSGIVYGFCIGIALPLNQSVAVKNTPPERWGAANALFQLANDIGIGGACVITGDRERLLRVPRHHLLRDVLHRGVVLRRASRLSEGISRSRTKTSLPGDDFPRLPFPAAAPSVRAPFVSSSTTPCALVGLVEVDVRFRVEVEREELLLLEAIERDERDHPRIVTACRKGRQHQAHTRLRAHLLVRCAEHGVRRDAAAHAKRASARHLESTLRLRHLHVDHRRFEARTDIRHIELAPGLPLAVDIGDDRRLQA